MAVILHAFEHPRELRTPSSPGLVIFDNTFKAVRADAHAIYGKSVQVGALHHCLCPYGGKSMVVGWGGTPHQRP